MQHIAFIGLGNMGAPMARNLVAAGFHVSVFDLAPAALAARRGHHFGGGPFVRARAGFSLALVATARHRLLRQQDDATTGP